MDTKIEPRKGYLYCLHNEMFNFYGENVYKLGEISDLKILPLYPASYLTSSTIRLASCIIDDSQLGEKILFYELKEYRMAGNGDFFKCELSKIKTVIDDISNLFKNKNLEEVREIYSRILDPKRILYENITEDTIEKIISSQDDREIELYIQCLNEKFVKTDETFEKIEKEIHRMQFDTSENEKELKNYLLYKNDNVKNKSSSDNYRINILGDINKILYIKWFDGEFIEKMKIWKKK